MIDYIEIINTFSKLAYTSTTQQSSDNPNRFWLHTKRSNMFLCNITIKFYIKNVHINSLNEQCYIDLTYIKIKKLNGIIIYTKIETTLIWNNESSKKTNLSKININVLWNRTYNVYIEMWEDKFIDFFF